MPAGDMAEAQAEAGLTALARDAARAAADPHGAEGEVITAVNAERNRPLYASRVKVYPKLVHGTFRQVKWLVLAVTLTVYYVTPWIRWDRGPNAPDQAVLIDFPERRFYFFWIELWPQEIYYVTGLLIVAALALFLVTSLFGRVWCGYACPQTVWTDLFVHVERWIEGDRSARIRLDRSPWRAGKLARKLAKHTVWLLISIATGGAWVFYFADAPSLLADIPTFEAPAAAYVFIGLFTATTYLLGGIAREQVCTYMCPWPRIQAAMVDENTLLVSYKADRGEPRGAHKKGASWEGRGDCIDCGQCVAACPTGIDIRDGAQLECIQCALCIDACNEIMDRVERPRGLIGYDSPQAEARRTAGLPTQAHILRPRTIVYAALIAVASAVMLVALTTRSPLDLNVLRDRNPLFVTLSDGSVRNGYTLKIINKEHDEQLFGVRVEGLDGARLTRQRIDGGDPAAVLVGPGEVESVKFFVTLPAGLIGGLDDGEAALRFIVSNAATGETAINETTFRGPTR